MTKNYNLIQILTAIRNSDKNILLHPACDEILSLLNAIVSDKGDIKSEDHNNKKNQFFVDGKYYYVPDDIWDSFLSMNKSFSQKEKDAKIELNFLHKKLDTIINKILKSPDPSNKLKKVVNCFPSLKIFLLILIQKLFFMIIYHIL